MKNSLLTISLLLSIIFYGCNSSEKKKETEASYKIATPTSQQNSLKESMERGGIIFTDYCMQCHIANGKGIPGTFPPLAQSNWLTEKRTESIKAVKYGQRGEIEVNGAIYNGLMAPMGLSDQEVADVMNYIMNSWGNTQTEIVTVDEVSKVLKD